MRYAYGFGRNLLQILGYLPDTQRPEIVSSIGNAVIDEGGRSGDEGGRGGDEGGDEGGGDGGGSTDVVVGGR
jgi:hypothetical protein